MLFTTALPVAFVLAPTSLAVGAKLWSVIPNNSIKSESRIIAFVYAVGILLATVKVVSTVYAAVVIFWISSA